jgi:hypothetical protein
MNLPLRAFPTTGYHHAERDGYYTANDNVRRIPSLCFLLFHSGRRFAAARVEKGKGEVWERVSGGQSSLDRGKLGGGGCVRAHRGFWDRFLVAFRSAKGRPAM